MPHRRPRRTPSRSTTRRCPCAPGPSSRRPGWWRARMPRPMPPSAWSWPWPGQPSSPRSGSSPSWSRPPSPSSTCSASSSRQRPSIRRRRAVGLRLRGSGLRSSGLRSSGLRSSGLRSGGLGRRRLRGRASRRRGGGRGLPRRAGGRGSDSRRGRVGHHADALLAEGAQDNAAAGGPDVGRTQRLGHLLTRHRPRRPPLAHEGLEGLVGELRWECADLGGWAGHRRHRLPFVADGRCPEGAVGGSGGGGEGPLRHRVVRPGGARRGGVTGAH